MKRGTFDDLSRILATSTSRRQALRRIAGMLFGGTVGGAALAELTPGIALAGGGNSNAAQFCSANFAPGPDRGQCVVAAAQGGGLFTSCGGGTQSVCCPTNANGQCTSYSSATCCSSGQSCMNGTCVASCPAGTVQLSNGSCATPCSGLNTPCGSCGSGFCIADASGVRYCANPNLRDGSCTTDSTCPQGYFCYFGDRCWALC